MAGRQKMLLPFGGTTLVEWSLRKLLQVNLGETIVVIGSHGEPMRDRLSPYPVTLVNNEAYGEGMASSIARGVAAAGPGTEGFLIALADMPMISKPTMNAVLDVFSAHCGQRIVAPFYGGRRGHPVIFSKDYREELIALKGDRGAAQVLRRQGVNLLKVEVPDCGILQDVDTLETLQRLDGETGKGEAQG